jgi:hypothetical protein
VLADRPHWFAEVARLCVRELPESGRKFDLLVVTPVDVDHIGGILSCFADLADSIPGLSFNDVWFNGLHNFAAIAGRACRLLNGSVARSTVASAVSARRGGPRQE